MGNRSDVQCRYRYQLIRKRSPTQCQRTPTSAEVEHPPGAQIVPAPATPNRFHHGLWECGRALWVQPGPGFGCPGYHFFGIRPW
jgi:hypothetical protein